MKRIAAPAEVLQTVFGYNEFRHNQQEIIEHLLNAEDAVVLMPTGGGKVYAIRCLLYVLMV